MRIAWSMAPHVIDVPLGLGGLSVQLALTERLGTRAGCTASRCESERPRSEGCRGRGHHRTGCGRRAEKRAPVEFLAHIDAPNSSLIGGSSDWAYQFPWVPLRRRKGSFTVATTPCSLRVASAMTRSDEVDS